MECGAIEDFEGDKIKGPAGEMALVGLDKEVAANSSAILVDKKLDLVIEHSASPKEDNSIYQEEVNPYPIGGPDKQGELDSSQELEDAVVEAWTDLKD